jgi:hypothetical protein
MAKVGRRLDEQKRSLWRQCRLSRQALSNRTDRVQEVEGVEAAVTFEATGALLEPGRLYQDAH